MFRLRLKKRTLQMAQVTKTRYRRSVRLNSAAETMYWIQLGSDLDTRVALRKVNLSWRIETYTGHVSGRLQRLLLRSASSTFIHVVSEISSAFVAVLPEVLPGVKDTI